MNESISKSVLRPFSGIISLRCYSKIGVLIVDIQDPR
jgi:hypothetical protein